MLVPDVREWKVESLRLTLFIQGQPGDERTEWWSLVCSSPSESQTFRAQSGDYIEQGQLGESRLQLRTQPGRIDWFYFPGEGISQEMPSIGLYSETSKQFFNLMSAWLGNIKIPITRIAFGAIIFHPENSREDGYGTIQKFLPFVKMDISRWRDFSFGYNIPLIVSLGSEEFKINRVMKFMAVAARLVLISPFSGAPVVENKDQASRIELDINSDAEYTKIISVEHANRLLENFMDINAVLAQEQGVPS